MALFLGSSRSSTPPTPTPPLGLSLRHLDPPYGQAAGLSAAISGTTSLRSSSQSPPPAHPSGRQTGLFFHGLRDLPRRRFRPHFGATPLRATPPFYKPDHSLALPAGSFFLPLDEVRFRVFYEARWAEAPPGSVRPLLVRRQTLPPPFSPFRIIASTVSFWSWGLAVGVISSDQLVLGRPSRVSCGGRPCNEL